MQDIGFAHNLGLDEGEMYLSRYIAMLYYSQGGVSSGQIITWNDDGTALVDLFGELHLFIPPNMCDDEALFNHNIRMGLIDVESGLGIENESFSRATNAFIEPFVANEGIVSFESSENIAVPTLRRHAGVEHDRIAYSLLDQETARGGIAFQWNEPSRQWFNLNNRVPQGRGTFSQNPYILPGVSPTRFATASIWGVNAIFREGDYGVIRTAEGTYFVRADVFYRTIVEAAGGEIIFLGGHGAFVERNPALHIHIVMFTTSDDFFNNSAFNTRWDGVRFATISGHGEWALSPLGWWTISQVNRQPYLDRAGLRVLNHIHTGPGKIKELFEAHEHFNDYYNRSFVYRPAPLEEGHFNSTSIIISMLNAVGLEHGLTATLRLQAVGILRHIEPRYFNR